MISPLHFYTNSSQTKFAKSISLFVPSEIAVTPIYSPLFKLFGYLIIHLASINGKSGTKEQRVQEFMSLWNDENVKSILFTTGGDFGFEILEELELDAISNSEPKWIAGYSDITNLGFVLTTNCDIATIYGLNYKSFGMKNLHKSLLNEIKIMSKEEFFQESFEKCESVDVFEKSTDPYAEWNLVNEVEWKSLNGEKEFEFSGRAIGGCFDVIMNLMGTKFDKIADYIRKYKDDGIVWFLENFEIIFHQLPLVSPLKHFPPHSVLRQSQPIQCAFNSSSAWIHSSQSMISFPQ